MSRQTAGSALGVLLGASLKAYYNAAAASNRITCTSFLPYDQRLAAAFSLLEEFKIANTTKTTRY